jgi:hypothetical protein
MTASVVRGVDELLPYVPRLLLDWAPTGADARHMRVSGSLAFVDISGFTRLTERLARKVAPMERLRATALYRGGCPT